MIKQKSVTLYGYVPPLIFYKAITGADIENYILILKKKFQAKKLEPRQ